MNERDLITKFLESGYVIVDPLKFYREIKATSVDAILDELKSLDEQRQVKDLDYKTLETDVHDYLNGIRSAVNNNYDANATHASGTYDDLIARIRSFADKYMITGAANEERLNINLERTAQMESMTQELDAKNAELAEANRDLEETNQRRISTHRELRDLSNDTTITNAERTERTLRMVQELETLNSDVSAKRRRVRELTGEVNDLTNRIQEEEQRYQSTYDSVQDVETPSLTLEMRDEFIRDLNELEQFASGLTTNSDDLRTIRQLTGDFRSKLLTAFADTQTASRRVQEIFERFGITSNNEPVQTMNITEPEFVPTEPETITNEVTPEPERNSEPEVTNKEPENVIEEPINNAEETPQEPTQEEPQLDEHSVSPKVVVFHNNTPVALSDFDKLEEGKEYHVIYEDSAVYRFAELPDISFPKDDDYFVTPEVYNAISLAFRPMNGVPEEKHEEFEEVNGAKPEEVIKESTPENVTQVPPAKDELASPEEPVQAESTPAPTSSNPNTPKVGDIMYFKENEDVDYYEKYGFGPFDGEKFEVVEVLDNGSLKVKSLVDKTVHEMTLEDLVSKEEWRITHPTRRARRAKARNSQPKTNQNEGDKPVNNEEPKAKRITVHIKEQDELSFGASLAVALGLIYPGKTAEVELQPDGTYKIIENGKVSNMTLTADDITDTNTLNHPTNPSTQPETKPEPKKVYKIVQYGYKGSGGFSHNNKTINGGQIFEVVVEPDGKYRVLEDGKETDLVLRPDSCKDVRIIHQLFNSDDFELTGEPGTIEDGDIVDVVCEETSFSFTYRVVTNGRLTKFELKPKKKVNKAKDKAEPKNKRLLVKLKKGDFNYFVRFMIAETGINHDDPFEVEVGPDGKYYIIKDGAVTIYSLDPEYCEEVILNKESNDKTAGSKPETTNTRKFVKVKDDPEELDFFTVYYMLEGDIPKDKPFEVEMDSEGLYYRVIKDGKVTDISLEPKDLVEVTKSKDSEPVFDPSTISIKEYDKEERHIVEVTVPGFNKEDFDINYEPSIGAIIIASKKADAPFKKEFPIPGPDHSDIKAIFEKGVLTINMSGLGKKKTSSSDTTYEYDIFKKGAEVVFHPQPENESEWSMYNNLFIRRGLEENRVYVVEEVFEEDNSVKFVGIDGKFPVELLDGAAHGFVTKEEYDKMPELVRNLKAFEVGSSPRRKPHVNKKDKFATYVGEKVDDLEPGRRYIVNWTMGTIAELRDFETGEIIRITDYDPEDFSYETEVRYRPEDRRVKKFGRRLPEVTAVRKIKNLERISGTLATIGIVGVAGGVLALPVIGAAAAPIVGYSALSAVISIIPQSKFARSRVLTKMFNKVSSLINEFQSKIDDADLDLDVGDLAALREEIDRLQLSKEELKNIAEEKNLSVHM